MVWEEAWVEGREAPGGQGGGVRPPPGRGSAGGQSAVRHCAVHWRAVRRGGRAAAIVPGRGSGRPVRVEGWVQGCRGRPDRGGGAPLPDCTPQGKNILVPKAPEENFDTKIGDPEIRDDLVGGSTPPHPPAMRVSGNPVEPWAGRAAAGLGSGRRGRGRRSARVGSAGCGRRRRGSHGKALQRGGGRWPGATSRSRRRCRRPAWSALSPDRCQALDDGIWHWGDTTQTLKNPDKKTTKSHVCISPTA